MEKATRKNSFGDDTPTGFPKGSIMDVMLQELEAGTTENAQTVLELEGSLKDLQFQLIASIRELRRMEASLRKKLRNLAYQTNSMKRRMNNVRVLYGVDWAVEEPIPTPPTNDRDQPEAVQAITEDVFMGVSDHADWDSASELQPLLQEPQPVLMDQSQTDDPSERKDHSESNTSKGSTDEIQALFDEALKGLPDDVTLDGPQVIRVEDFTAPDWRVLDLTEL